MIYFLSDAHLGSLAINDGRAHLDKLLALLDEMSKDATSIFMLGDKIGYRWAKRQMEKELAKPTPFRGKYKEHLVLFAIEQEQLGYHHDYYVFGHRHIAEDVAVSENSHVILLGDCFRQFTYASFNEQGILTLHKH